jgi:hypothetical protein
VRPKAVGSGLSLMKSRASCASLLQSTSLKPSIMLSKVVFASSTVNFAASMGAEVVVGACRCGREQEEDGGSWVLSELGRRLWGQSFAVWVKEVRHA